MPALTLLFHNRPTMTIPLDAERGQSVLEAIITAGLAELVDAECGGRGTCGRCRIRVLGDAPEPSPAEEELLSPEELADGVRLACQLHPVQDLTVQLIVPTHVRRAKEDLAGQLHFEAQPAVRKVHLVLPQPSLADQRSDWLRLWETLRDEADLTLAGPPPLSVLRELPGTLRAGDFRVTAVLHEGGLVAVEPGDTRDRLLAVAVDIGTTTIAVYLLDLVAGRQLAVVAGSNPQAAFGADVISRISAVMEDPAALSEMQRLVAKAINELVAEAGRRAGVSPTDVYEAVVVGNSCMLQLFAGVDPRHLAASPYVPAFNEILTLPATEVGLALNSAARACLLPGIGGYVGADIVADILATGLHRLEGVRLLIDVGTNGEIVLARDGQVVTCATAAGPAFEGAHIECGMRAAAGAIEQVSQDGEFRLVVIGDEEPQGLCGSGLLDVAAALVRAGVVDSSGRFRPPEALPAALRSRLIIRDGSPAFLLAETAGRPVYLSQQDVRQLQMAKGAIRAGINILLGEYGLTSDDLDEVLLAGAFGSYLTPDSALAIGLLPPLPAEHIRAVGNTAGEGASMAALSISARAEAVEISRQSEYVELSVRQDFQEMFIKELSFPAVSPP